MKNKLLNDFPIHESTMVGLCLAVVGGFLDAYTYIFRGGVFANAQTGNMVLMGISFSKGDFIKSGLYFIPIFAFFLGIVTTEYLKRRFSNTDFISWQHITLGIEACMLLIIGFIPRQTVDLAVNTAVSFVCSLQVNSFRNVKGEPYATTMCTGNLRSGAEQLCRFLFDKKQVSLMKSLRYFAVILAFCCGAAAGAVITIMYKEKSVWICSVMLFGVLGMMLWDSKKQSDNTCLEETPVE
jgi:Predicted membrane protein